MGSQTSRDQRSDQPAALRGAAVLLVLMLMTGLSTGVAGLAVIGETFSPGMGESSACWRGLTQRIALATRRAAPAVRERARPMVQVAVRRGVEPVRVSDTRDEVVLGPWRLLGAHRLDLPPPAAA